MKALIFAAGLGTRLRPLTDSLPKALVNVGGETLLSHVIRRLKAAGLDDIVINTCFFAEKISTYLAENNNFGIRISISDERGVLRNDALSAVGGAVSDTLSSPDGAAHDPHRALHSAASGLVSDKGSDTFDSLPPIESPLETGGGIRFAEPLLKGSGHFLIHNVDIVSDLDLPWFISQSTPNSLATLLVSERKTQRYFLFDDDMRMVGWTNIATGEVRSPYPGLDPTHYRKLAFAGIHILSEKAFGLFGEYGFGRKFSITDFYIRSCKDYPIYGIAPDNLTLIDVGKHDTLALADSWLRARQ